MPNHGPELYILSKELEKISKTIEFIDSTITLNSWVYTVLTKINRYRNIKVHYAM